LILEINVAWRKQGEDLLVSVLNIGGVLNGSVACFGEVKLRKIGICAES